MTKKEAVEQVSSFLIQHIEAGSLWNDETYYKDIQALSKLGYKQAIDAMAEFKKQGGVKV